MGSCFLEVNFFDDNGKTTGNGGQTYLPDYLDWLPIEAKVFWFFERGLGDPAAKHVLFKSQGEQQLSEVKTPLQRLKHRELQEKERGIKSKVDDFIAQRGISRTPRNQ